MSWIVESPWPGVSQVEEPCIMIWGIRSCSWNRCKFCVANEEYIYRERSPENIVQEIEYQSQKYNIDYFLFVDNDFGRKDRNEFDKLLKLLYLSAKNRNKPYHMIGMIAPQRIDRKSIRAMKKIAFDNTGKLYATQQTGEIYTVDLTNGSSTLLVIAGININAIAFHPQLNELWAAKRKILGTGKETKILSQISNATKEYIAKIEFGKSTDTYDITGTILKHGDTQDIEEYDFKPILDSFLGESKQIPPMFSAKKVGGKRLYKMARKGIEIERKAQNIFIHDIKSLKREDSCLDVYVKCSKGTYLRTLAYDIGEKSGYGAYLKRLRRVAIDDYNIEKALSVKDFNDYWNSIN